MAKHRVISSLHLLRVSMQLALLFLLTAVASAQRSETTPEYQGKVYTEISIDNNGIILIDSANNEIMVPVGLGFDEEMRRGPRPPDPVVEFNPDDYPRKIQSIRRIGRSVIIDEDEHVYGDVAVVGGDATIKGLVEGSVSAPAGRVRVTGTGVVIGSIVANEVVEESGSRVYGTVAELRLPGRVPEATSKNGAGAVIGGTIYLAVLFLLTFAAGMLFPAATDRLKRLFTENFIKAFLVGILVWLLMLPVFVLLAITIIGAPIAAIGMPLAMLAAALLGGAAFCLFVSDFISSVDHSGSRARNLVVGFALVQIPAVGMFLGIAIDATALIVICAVMFGLLTLLVTTLSFGGVVLTRFGTRDHPGEKVSITVEVAESTTVRPS